VRGSAIYALSEGLGMSGLEKAYSLFIVTGVFVGIYFSFVLPDRQVWFFFLFDMRIEYYLRPIHTWMNHRFRLILILCIQNITGSSAGGFLGIIHWEIKRTYLMRWLRRWKNRGKSRHVWIREMNASGC